MYGTFPELLNFMQGLRCAQRFDTVTRPVRWAVRKGWQGVHHRPTKLCTHPSNACHVLHWYGNNFCSGTSWTKNRVPPESQDKAQAFYAREKTPLAHF